MNIKIGIDIGNVIIGGDTDRPDIFFTDDYLDCPPIQDSLESIANLSKVVGPENVHLVSKCAPRVERKSIDWLRHRDFTGLTGIAEGNLHFCRKRKEKRKLSDQLGLNYFIDDRYTVLMHLLDLPEMRRMYLFRAWGDEETAYEEAGRPGNVVRADSWEAVTADLGPLLQS